MPTIELAENLKDLYWSFPVLDTERFYGLHAMDRSSFISQRGEYSLEVSYTGDPKLAGSNGHFYLSGFCGGS